MKCHDNKGLVIKLGSKDDIITFSRCCFLKPFYSCKIDEFYNIKDIFKFAKENDNHKKDLLDETKDRCQECSLKKEITSVSVDLSKACNLHCYHCFRLNHVDNKEIKKLYFNTLKKVKGHQLESLSLTDEGEPFFYFKETIKFLKSLSYKKDFKKIIFTTNLTLLDYKKIELLRKVSLKTKIEYVFICSIDGCDKRSYEATRRGANFDKTIYNYSLLLKTFGPESARVAFTLKKTNCKCVNEVVPFFKNLGVKILTCYYDFFDQDMKSLFYSTINQFEFLF